MAASSSSPVPAGFRSRQAATAARARASSPGVSSRYLTAAGASLSRVRVWRIPAVKPSPGVAWKCCPVVTRRAVHRSTPGGMAHAMAEFAAEVRRLMAERGLSLRGLAKAASYDPSYLSKVLSGHKPSSPYLAARLDDALGAGGTIRDATQQPPPRRESRASAPRRVPSGAVEALQVAMTGDPAGPDIGADGLAELVQHYAHALAVAPSAAV